MAAEHTNVTVVSADAFKDQVIVYFSDGTTALFQSHFLYEVREHNGNVVLTNLSDEELIEGFDGKS